MKSAENIFNAILILLIFSVSVYSQEIHEAVKKGEIEKVKKLLAEDPGQVRTKDIYGRTPLHWAVRAQTDENAKEMCALLIEKGADVNAKDNSSVAAIHSAALRGYVKTSELLIKNSTKIDEKDGTGNTPLSYAVSASQNSIIELLKSNGLQIPDKGAEAEALIFSAVSNGNKEFFEFMVSKGADLNIRDDKNGSLLFSASAGGNKDIVSILLQKNLNVNAVNKYGITPLFTAALNGSIEVTELLINRGAEINITNPAGHSPLFYSELNGHHEIIDLLIKNGAKKSLGYIPVKTGEYLGLKKPGDKPEIFAQGIVSSDFDEHGYVSISPDGKEMYWTIIRRLPGAFRGTIMFSKMENGYWTTPCSPSFADKNYDNWYATPTTDGNRIFFSSRRPIKEGGEPLNPMGGMHIWYVEREKDEWSESKLLNTAVSTGDDFALSISKNGSLYFSSMREGGMGNLDIYCSKFVNGEYSVPENLEKINSEHYEDGPFVSPDESYLIFESSRPGGFDGSIDLYISFKKRDGSWSDPINMGDKINSSLTDRWGRVSPDGKYLFFGRWKNWNSDIFWINAKIIEELKPDELN